jgi:uncharacterized protein CbrC (UPF0167 family)
MFICDECRCFFDDPERVEERHPYGESYAIEEYYCCPKCGGGFSEASICEECGEYFAEEELVGGLCPECLEKAKESVAETICKTFTKDQFEDMSDDLLEDIWELVYKKYNK